MARRRALSWALVALGLAACSSPPAPVPPPAAYRVVEFPARDGETRSGRVFGDGAVGVVLSHMGRKGDGQEDWAGFAQVLADRGYRVLTYQGRDDHEDSWQDVLGAADHLADAGAARIVVGGASIGAMASMRAARDAPPEVTAVIWFAGERYNRGYDFTEADVAVLRCPVLFLTGDEDTYDNVVADTRQMRGWAKDSELVTVPTRRHGTDILADGGPLATQVRNALTAFIDRVADDDTPCSA